jgi:hypothetical protein
MTNPIPLSDLLDKVGDSAVELLRKKMLLLIATNIAIPFWGKLVAIIANWVVDKFIIPLMSDGELEIIAWVKKKELHTKVVKYDEAQTDEETDEAFDDLLSGSRVR